MSQPVEQIREVAREIAAVHAAEVDRDARFPIETLTALRGVDALGALIPVELGGQGLGLDVVSAQVRELGRRCASSAMILAMHHIQVASLVRHGSNEHLREFARRVAVEQLLLASATTEIGIGGNTRNSSCAVELAEDGSFTLTKTAPVISYGEHADAILATARRTPDSAPSDQVLVVCPVAGVTLERLSGWDTLGFRGTCSLGFQLTATGPGEAVLDDPFGDISAATMLPVAHLLWSSLWLGLADEATDRARRFVQQAAKRDLGTLPPGAPRLAELMVVHQQLASSVDSVLRRYLEIQDDPAATGSVGFGVAINTLKVSASTQVVDVVNRAMTICGIAGYREDSDVSLGRLLRDAHGAAVMVNNDRLIANTAQQLLVLRGH